MKNRQTRIIIGILVGLVLFASSIALLMYTKQSGQAVESSNNIEVYVANQHLTQGHKITASDIVKAYLPSSYIPSAPLTPDEIIGRYTQVEIFAKEPLRKEKISLLQPTEEQPKTLESSAVKIQEMPAQKGLQMSDTVTVPLTLFQNIDTTLKTGDYIDIVSIIPSASRGKDMEFNTKYIALHVLINSFVSNAAKIDNVTLTQEKKILRADSVVFEMSPSDIKNFLSTYYKTQELNANRVFNTSKTNNGHLWMVKCSDEVDEKSQKAKDRLMVDYVSTYKKVRAKAVEQVSISYEN
jgi:hypothetical protein